MHDNFEKEVQQKMGEMHLTPSAPVWEKIELEIREEKKRRRGIFWFLLAGFLLAGGGWWGYQSLQNKRQQANTKIETPVKKSSHSTTSASTPSNPQLTGSEHDKPAIIETTHGLNKKPQGNATNATVTKQKRFDEKIVEIVRPENIRTVTSKEQVLISTIDKDKKQDSQVTSVTPLKVTTSTNDATPSAGNGDTLSVAKKQMPVVTDSAIKPITGKEKTPPASIDSSLKRKVAAAGKKWKKQITINAGRSNYASGLFSNMVAGINDAFQSSTGGTPNFANASPAKVRGGFAFATGVHLAKQLSKKWEFVVGLQYSCYSTQTSLGDKRAVDTAISFNMDKMAVAEFYTNTGRNNYTSRFHVVEIPVSFSYQLMQKAPVHISVGVSYGRLLSTNALTYSTTSNLYYENRENYNRNYLPVTAAVQYRFQNKKGVSIQTGPVVQYNLLKLQKEASAIVSHLFFAGLKTDIRF